MDLDVAGNVHKSIPWRPAIDFGYKIYHRCDKLVVSSLFCTHVYLDFVCDQRDTEIHHRSDSISMVFSPKFHSGSCIERGSTSCIQSCNDHHFRYHLPVNLNCTSHPPTSTVTASPLNERSNDLRLLFDPYTNRSTHQSIDSHICSNPLSSSPSFCSRTKSNDLPQSSSSNNDSHSPFFQRTKPPDNTSSTISTSEASPPCNAIHHGDGSWLWRLGCHSSPIEYRNAGGCRYQRQCLRICCRSGGKFHWMGCTWCDGGRFERNSGRKCCVLGK